jgi:ketosteroid isomerase-like protein
MTTQTIEAEVMELENRFWQAMKDHDVDTMVELTDEPCVLTGPQGLGMIDRKALAGMMKDATYTLDSFDIKDGAKVRQVGDDIAIAGYTVHEELTVDGERITLDAVDSSTWVRTDGHWRCAAHSESILGDPFGRDRKPAT